MVKNDLRLQMTAATFDTWLKGTTAHRDGDTLTIRVQNRFAYEWLTMRLRPLIAKTVKEICGNKTTIEFEKPGEPTTSPHRPGVHSVPTSTPSPRLGREAGDGIS